MTAPSRPAHGAGSTWDTPDAVDRILRAYHTPDLIAVRQAQIDVLGPIEGAEVLAASKPEAMELFRGAGPHPEELFHG